MLLKIREIERKRYLELAGRRRFKLDVKVRVIIIMVLGILSSKYLTYVLTGFMFDLGFLGVEKNFPQQKSSLPIKKEKDCELTAGQKKYNKHHSAKRKG